MSEGITPNQLTPVVPVFKAIVTLTDAQIKALPTTGIEIVPAQGAGKGIVPITWVIKPTLVAGYMNIDAFSTMRFAWVLGGSSSGIDPGFTEEFGGNVIDLLQNGVTFLGSPYINVDFGNTVVKPKSMQTFDNAWIRFMASNSGNFTGGDAANILKIIMLYMTIDLEAE